MAAISPFNFHGHAVRVVMRDGEPWFVATDVCAALEYSNPSKAVADHLDDDERSHEQLDRSRMGSKAIIINESGLYALVLRSRKPEARKFAKWVTGEVLPSIRKTGRYAVQQELPINDIAHIPGFFKAMESANALAGAVQLAAIRELTKGGSLHTGRFALFIDQYKPELGQGIFVKEMHYAASLSHYEEWPEMIERAESPSLSVELLERIAMACIRKVGSRLAIANESNDMLRESLRRATGKKPRLVGGAA